MFVVNVNGGALRDDTNNGCAEDYSIMADSADPVCLADFENCARGHLPKYAFDFLAGGANDENTIRENVEAFKRCEEQPARN